MACLEIIEWDGTAYDGCTYFGQPYDPTVGNTFQLTEKEIRVGRHPANDLVLDVASVSRCQFRLFLEDGHYVFQETLSRQRLIYNGEAFPAGERRVCQDGDTFTAAGIVFRYRDS